MKRIILLFSLILSFSVLFAQQKSVSGRVTDENNDPIPGANVAVKGTTIGTITDTDGNYMIKIPESSNVLTITFIGFESQDVSVAGKNTVSVKLKLSSIGLDEVVVIGYGKMKKSDLAGSISSLSSKDLATKPLATIEQGIRGKLAGVHVKAISGAPGAGTNIRIRGGTSVNGGMEPLYVIDGIPMYSDKRFDAMDPLSTISPSDIESIDVLKDASASAIYGSRGANGVIIVTTKKGKAGRNIVNLNIKAGIQQVAKILDFIDGPEFIRLAKQGWDFTDAINKLTTPPTTTVGYLKDPSFAEINTDWQQEIFRTAPMQSIDFSVVGGNEKTTHALSLSSFDQKGIVLGSDFKRYSGRLNVDHKISKFMDVGTSFMLSNSVKNELAEVVSAAINSLPIMPVYDENGSYALMRNYSNFGTAANNPVALANDALNKTVGDRMISNSYIAVKPIDNLEIKFNLGLDIFNSINDNYIPSTVERGLKAKGKAIISTNRNQTFLYEGIAHYNLDYWKDKGHRADVMAGFLGQSNISNSTGSNSQGFLSDVFKTYNVGAAVTKNSISSGKSSYAMNSFIGRLNYSYMDKYMLTATMRADGSSRFGANNKWGMFPSAALAWRINSEPFLEGNKIITNAKIRASYGKTGNQEIGSYLSLQRISSADVALDQTGAYKGYYTSNIGYPELSWEKTNQFDAGLDLSLFNRISITFDYYKKITSGVLFNVTPPLSTGFSLYLKNAGEISNKGIEIALNADVIRRKNITWNVDFNFSRNRNLVEDLGGSSRIVVNGSGGSKVVVDVGQPVGAFYGFIIDGLFQSWQEIYDTPWANARWNADNSTKDLYPGHYKTRDLNDDGAITEADQTFIGDPNPDFTYGFTTSMTLKNFDFSLSLYGSYGNDIFNISTRGSKVFAGNNKVLKQFADASLSEPRDSNDPNNIHITGNPPATYTFLGQYPNRTNTNISRDIEDGSFLRISDLTIGYTLDLKKFNYGQKVRFYASVYNLYTFTSYIGYDPDVNNAYGLNAVQSWSNGYDLYPYPVARTYMFGVNYTF